MKKSASGLLIAAAIACFSQIASAEIVTVTPANLNSFLSGSFSASLIASGYGKDSISAVSSVTKTQLSAQLAVSGSLRIDTAAITAAASITSGMKMNVQSSASVVATMTLASGAGVETSVISEVAAAAADPAGYTEISAVIREIVVDPDRPENLGQFVKETVRGAKAKGLKGKAMAKHVKAAKEAWKAKHKKGNGKGNSKKGK